MKASRALARQAKAHEATQEGVGALKTLLAEQQAQLELLASELQAEREISAKRHAELVAMIEKLQPVQPKAK